jgi:hypothetical protein
MCRGHPALILEPGESHGRTWELILPPSRPFFRQSPAYMEKWRASGCGTEFIKTSDSADRLNNFSIVFSKIVQVMVSHLVRIRFTAIVKPVRHWLSYWLGL